MSVVKYTSVRREKKLTNAPCGTFYDRAIVYMAYIQMYISVFGFVVLEEFTAYPKLQYTALKPGTYSSLSKWQV